MRADAGSYDCTTCEQKKKALRNCHNHADVLHPILNGPEDWKLYPPEKKPVAKLDRTKFFACPVSTITPHTWEMIRLGNACLTGEDDAITTLPFSGGYLEQPPWFREAMEIIRGERGRYRKEQLEKLKNKKG